MWDMSEFDLARRMREGAEILRQERLIEEDRQSIQRAKDRQYNETYVLTNDDEFVFRIDRTHIKPCALGPTWWYLPFENKDFLFKSFDSFDSDIHWIHEVWEDWFDFDLFGMFSLHLSKVEKDGYFPVRMKYRESKYSDGTHWSWDLSVYVSNPRHLLYDSWDYVGQGLREFIRFGMGYSPESITDQVFTLWMKIDNIAPSSY